MTAVIPATRSLLLFTGYLASVAISLTPLPIGSPLPAQPVAIVAAQHSAQQPSLRKRRPQAPRSLRSQGSSRSRDAGRRFEPGLHSSSVSPSLDFSDTLAGLSTASGSSSRFLLGRSSPRAPPASA